MSSLIDQSRGLVARAAAEARALLSALLVPLRVRRGIRLSKSVPREARSAGWISVVIPTRDVGRFIDACMRSVLGQGYWRLDVIVLDDASSDSTRAKLDRWARRDSRVRVIGVDFSDPNAARNFGIEHATGEFLTFLDGDDILLAGAYRDLIGSLAASGSDFAVGGYDRLTGRRRTPAAFWIDEAHANERRRTRLEESPSILVNAVQWSKLYRRAFWDDADMRFPTGGHFQDQIVSAQAYARAAAFDVLTRKTVSWRIRDDGTSMTQQSVRPQQIADRFTTTHAALDVLASEASDVVAAARLVQYLSNDIAIAAAQLPGMGPEAFDTLCEGLRGLAPERSRAEVWDNVPAESKVLYEFLIEGDEERARRYIQLGGLDLLRHSLEVVDGVSYVTLPFWGDVDAAVPLARFRAAPRELRAFASRRQILPDESESPMEGADANWSDDPQVASVEAG